MYLYRRISFYGCETGYSMLAIVDSEKNEILQYFAEHYQSPITVMELFNIYNITAETKNILSGALKMFFYIYNLYT